MSSREQFEIWGCSDRDLSITLKCETYAGIAWLAWQAATSAMEANCAALAAEVQSVKAMNDCLSEELRRYESDGEFEGPKMHLLWWKAETPATDAFRAEERAQGVEMYASKLEECAKDAESGGFDAAAQQLRSEALAVREFAAEFLEGVQS